MAEQIRGYRPRTDPQELRRSLIRGGIVFGAVLALATGLWLSRRARLEPVEVLVRGHGEVGLETSVTFVDAGGKTVAEGKSDRTTGLYATKVPPGTYSVEAVVFVRETDRGLPSGYPNRAALVVNAGAAGPARATIDFPSVVPHPWKPGEYAIRKVE